MVRFFTQVQSDLQRDWPEIPVHQSGLGPNIVNSEIRGWVRFTETRVDLGSIKTSSPHIPAVEISALSGLTSVVADWLPVGTPAPPSALVEANESA